jgi:hypothetical protein
MKSAYLTVVPTSLYGMADIGRIGTALQQHRKAPAALYRHVQTHSIDSMLFHLFSSAQLSLVHLCRKCVHQCQCFSTSSASSEKVHRS